MATPERPADPFTDALLALPYIRTWEDCGIPSVRYYKLQATCGQHGSFLETHDSPPKTDYLICLHCSFAGVTRKCPIRGVLLMAEGFVPE